MRFAADDIHRIRKGEITVIIRRWQPRPSSFKVGSRHAIQRVEDVRKELDDEQVVYERVVTTLEESVEISGRERQVLDQLPPEVVAAAGVEDLEQLVDAIRADHGGAECQLVWVFTFQMTDGKPRFLARQNGLASPPQYTSNPARAIDELEVVSASGPKWNEKLEEQRKQAWAREREVIAGSIERLEADPHIRDELGGQLRSLRRHLTTIDRKLYGVAA